MKVREHVETANEIVISTPSFGKYSSEPFEAIADLGLTHRSVAGGKPLTGIELAAALGESPAIIVGLDAADRNFFEAASNLKVIAKHGVGVDNIDLHAADDHGVVVVNAPGTNAGAVADLTMGLLLGLLRQIPKGDALVRGGEWQSLFGPELSGKRIGLVGFGRIAREVAKRAQGFGMDVVASDPYVSEEVFLAAEAQKFQMDDLLATADIISLHSPASEKGPLIGADSLYEMKEGVYLVNAGRGALVDEAAVARALCQGRLAGYAADAFIQEPPVDSPLMDAPNTLFTPHIGAFSDRANSLMGVTVARDVALVLSGQEPHNRVSL